MIDYDKMVEGLKALRRDIEGDPKSPLKPVIQTLDDTLFCLSNYCEPWICPDCGNYVKIPHNRRKPNVCNRCSGTAMTTYAYMEQHRMSWQLAKLLECLQTYANRWLFGKLAKKVLKDVQKVPKPGRGSGLQIPK